MVKEGLIQNTETNTVNHVLLRGQGLMSSRFKDANGDFEGSFGLYPILCLIC